MKDAIEKILVELSGRGYRITKARREVLQALSAQKQPQTIQQLCKESRNADEASVYRTIRTLVEEGFVEEILIQKDTPHYALADGHHHHAVCTSCGVMEHVACVSHDVPVPSSFRSIKEHEVVLYGLCKKCA
jgi:Fur family transcriptional regulator, ferric uptake regulator